MATLTRVADSTLTTPSARALIAAYSGTFTSAASSVSCWKTETRLLRYLSLVSCENIPATARLLTLQEINKLGTSRLAVKGGTSQFYSSTPHLTAEVARRPNLQRYIDLCTLLKQHNDVRPTKLALLDFLSRAHSWDA